MHTQAQYISREELMEIYHGMNENIQAGFDKVVSAITLATAPLQSSNPAAPRLELQPGRRWKPKITNNPVRRPFSKLEMAVSVYIHFFLWDLQSAHLEKCQKAYIIPYRRG
jgi:hypothetical protein